MPMDLNPATTAAYDILPLGIAIISLDGTIEYCNGAHARLYEYRPEEMIGLPVAELMADPEHAELFRQFIAKHAAGTYPPAPFETMVTSARERTFPIRVQWQHWYGDSERIKGFIGIVNNVQEEQTQLEHLTIEQDRLYHNIMGAELGTWDWNITTGDVVFNERWAAMLGYRLDEIEPHVRVWETLIHPEEKAWVMMVLEDHLSGATDLYETEHRLRQKDGHWIWVLDKGRVFERDTAGKPIRACGVHLDISARKKTEALLRSEKRFNKNLITTANTIILVLAPDGTIQFFNPYFETISGRRLEETKGLDWFDTFLPDDERDAVHSLFEGAISESPTKGRITTILAADGKRLQVEWYDTCLKEDDGRVTALLATGQDVTDRIEAQDIIRRANTELEAKVAARTGDLQAALAEARINADRYLALAENIPFGVITVDQDLRVITANQVARRWWPSLRGKKETFCCESLFCPVGDADQTDCPDCPARRSIQDGSINENKTHTRSTSDPMTLRVITVPVPPHGNADALFEQTVYLLNACRERMDRLPPHMRHGYDARERGASRHCG